MNLTMDPSAAASATDPSPLLWGALVVSAYLIGSFPTAHLLARSRGVDLGTVGSKSYGATNLGRTLGRGYGIACFFIDALKGALPTIGAGWMLGALGAAAGSVSTATAWCWLASAACAILGHTLSPWIGFKGGKGVATGFGALVAMWPVLTLPAVLAFVLWAVLLAVFRIMSLASMVAAVSIPCSVLVAAVAASGLAGVRASVPFLAASGAIALFVVWKHRANIARMRAGTEPRIGAKKDAGAATPAPETK
jgi:glycerol-3-phosphate acyltransferase PlsY